MKSLGTFSSAFFTVILVSTSLSASALAGDKKDRFTCEDCKTPTEKAFNQAARALGNRSEERNKKEGDRVTEGGMDKTLALAPGLFTVVVDSVRDVAEESKASGYLEMQDILVAARKYKIAYDSLPSSKDPSALAVVPQIASLAKAHYHKLEKTGSPSISLEDLTVKAHLMVTSLSDSGAFLYSDKNGKPFSRNKALRRFVEELEKEFPVPTKVANNKSKSDNKHDEERSEKHSHSENVN